MKKAPFRGSFRRFRSGKTGFSFSAPSWTRTKNPLIKSRRAPLFFSWNTGLFSTCAPSAHLSRRRPGAWSCADITASCIDDGYQLRIESAPRSRRGPRVAITSTAILAGAGDRRRRGTSPRSAKRYSWTDRPGPPPYGSTTGVDRVTPARKGTPGPRRRSPWPTDWPWIGTQFVSRGREPIGGAPVCLTPRSIRRAWWSSNRLGRTYWRGGPPCGVQAHYSPPGWFRPQMAIPPPYPTPPARRCVGGFRPF
jgi:hypothetical protein